VERYGGSEIRMGSGWRQVGLRVALIGISPSKNDSALKDGAPRFVAGNVATWKNSDEDGNREEGDVIRL
jgi:hypothetical protein